ncbi:universal stress protein [Microbacterium resistens]|uniref:Universal stress protein n=1 Tax=Microbacterium resistens TaxID=156977 RepID=A0ABY3RY54_9MICO|nr:universal stress protein [Microbacterium resistens]UGS28300.1 universal stress protein [Microbacterium resistens]
MSAGIVVGYTATDAGSDAAVFGARLARALGTRLHLVIVLPRDGTRSAAVAPDRAYEDVIRGQARTWLDEALRTLPQDVPRSAHVRFGESFAEGLVAAGEEFGARMIVVGAAGGGLLGRHRLGSVASELLHSSTLPVALVPAGGAADPATALTRVTAALGTRPGADVLLDEAVGLAGAAGASLRLISLMPFDVPPGLDTGAIRIAGDEHGEDVLSAARAALPAGVSAEVERAPGDSVEDAVAHLDWQPGEVVLVGSSRLAQPRRLFLGSTAAKMLHVLPVPMIVVPRTRAAGHPLGGDPA